MWFAKEFDELAPREIFQIFKNRVDIFVVEQECPYTEIDYEDLNAIHLFKMENNTLYAYCRIIETQNEIKIGRVLVHKEYREHGLAKELLKRALACCNKQFPDQTVYIQAQEYLQSFYQTFGFKAISDIYLEDNIPHLDMIINKGKT